MSVGKFLFLGVVAYAAYRYIQWSNRQQLRELAERRKQELNRGEELPLEGPVVRGGPAQLPAAQEPAEAGSTRAATVQPK